MHELVPILASGLQLPTWIATISQAILALFVLAIVASGLLSIAWTGFRRWLFTEVVGRVWVLISAKGTKADRVRTAYTALAAAVMDEAALGGQGLDRHLRVAKIQQAIDALELECPEVVAVLEPIARQASQNSYFDTGTARQWLRAVRREIQHYLD